MDYMCKYVFGIYLYFSLNSRLGAPNNQSNNTQAMLAIELAFSQVFVYLGGDILMDPLILTYEYHTLLSSAWKLSQNIAFFVLD